MKKAIIIGAGISGIATAIRLQCAGFQVEIFELNSYPGGKLSELKLGEYRFDAGPSLFTMPQFVEELFNLAGKKTTDFFQYKKKEIACQYYFDDDTAFTAYADMQQYLSEAKNVFGVNEKVLETYFKKNEIKFNLVKPIFLEKSLNQLKNYLNVETIKAILSSYQLSLFSTLHQFNTKKLQNQKLVQLFDRYATYNGSSPYLTPGIMSLIPHLEQHFGVFIPKGGMISITQALYDLAISLGIKFQFNQEVDRIQIEQKIAKGIHIKDKFIEADIVVSNMDIVPTYRRLLKEEKAPEKVLQQERSSSALIFYWGIQYQFPKLDLHNIFFSKDYKAEFDAIFNTKTVADDITIYINITCKDEKNDAPSGCENWFVMINVPSNTNQDWDEIIERTRKNIIMKLSSHLKVNIEDLIVCESILDPRSIESKTQSYQGALYGAASNNQFAAFLRHPNFTQKIKNLYFCGGSVHPGGGIPLCLLSAKITADLITRN